MGSWTPSVLQQWCCTLSGCVCEGFLPNRRLFRSCDRCSHTWLQHALGNEFGSAQLEPVECESVCSLGALFLLGTHSVPVQLRILLDRLLSVLTHSQVIGILQVLGWTLQDYTRGYKLQDSIGNVLDRWVSVTAEEECVILQQFLRFGETRSIVEIMLEETSPKHADSNIPGTSMNQNPDVLQPVHNRISLFYLKSICKTSLNQHPLRENQQCLSEQIWSPEQRHKTPKAMLMLQSSSDKGRVKCDSCEKTFYDKGTLKIHFNAVHLKIKHRCTIDGCDMMFSSLRSRNRHSANPNPRLHATLQHQILTQPGSPGKTAQVSLATRNFVNVEQFEFSKGKVKDCLTNQNDLVSMTAKKSRKSSTPLKIRQDYPMMLPGQPACGLYGNQSLIRNKNQLCDHKYCQKLLCGCHGNRVSKSSHQVNEEWKARWKPGVKVKEELYMSTP